MTLLNAAQCFARFGDPAREAEMVLWDVPAELEIGVIPKRIYCNRYLVAPLGQAFRNLIERHVVDQLKTWDGCFNIRRKRGGNSASLHSWGVAIDVNAAWNGFGKPPTLSDEFVECFTEAGFDWGGLWRIPDGMHLQLHELPP